MKTVEFNGKQYTLIAAPTREPCVGCAFENCGIETCDTLIETQYQVYGSNEDQLDTDCENSFNPTIYVEVK